MPPQHVDSDSDASLESDGPSGTIGALLKSKNAKKSETSDDEEDDEGFETPQSEPVDKGKSKAQIISDDEEGNEDDGDDDDEEGGEEEAEYIVEKITRHAVSEACSRRPIHMAIADLPKSNVVIYFVKWKDYPSSQNTWETEDNLTGAKDVLHSYFAKIGGRPTDERNPRDSLKKRGRKPAEPESSSKRSKSEQVAIRESRRKSGKTEDVEEAIKWPGVKSNSEWRPPKPRKDSWEDILLRVEALEADDDGTKWAFVLWSVEDESGRKRTSKVLLESVSIAAPQATLKFYENHLVFTKPKEVAADSENRY